MKSKKSVDKMEIESNSKIISPEQLKKDLLNINISLCNYMKSLIYINLILTSKINNNAQIYENI